ncbi:unnamed protein product [Heterobilharzia americana]|nr:unnamed protein product [Heterobilharzia americana]
MCEQITPTVGMIAGSNFSRNTNKNARVPSLPKSNRTVKLVAYIQATTFASTRAIIGFRINYSSASPIFKEIEVPIIADYRDFKNIWNPSFNFSLVSKATEVEKFFEVEFILTAPPASRQLYAVELGIGRVILGEICHCSITKVGTGINTRIPGVSF